MAGIDYTIPGQFKGIQLESPMNAMTQAMQLRNLQESSEMNALKKQEYARAREEENALRTLFASGVKPDSDEFRNQLYARAPGLAPGIEKNILDRGKAASEIRYKDAQASVQAAEALSKKLDFHQKVFNPLAVTTEDQAAAHAAAFYDNPDFAPYATKMMTREQAIAKSRELFKTDKNAWLKSQLTLSGDKILEATERREKELRTEQKRAYSDYVFDAINSGNEPLSEAAFLSSLNAAPTAVPTDAPAPAPAPAPSPASAAAVSIAPNGEKILPGVETVAGIFGIHPQAAALYRTGDPRDKATADAIQAAHVEQKKREQLTGDFQNVMVAEQMIAELERNPTPLNLKKIAALRKQIKAANEGRAPKNYNIVKMPEGVKAVDQKYAQDYLEWSQGGGADAAANMGQIKFVLDRLAAGENLTGPSIGLAPDFFNALVNPQALNAKQAVEEVVQRNLRAVLGAQFTQVEGERLISRAFDARLSPQENIKRLRKLFLQMQTAAQQKQAMAEYYEANETLRGYKGKQPKMQDFYDALSTPDAPPKGSVDVKGPDGKMYRFPDKSSADKFKKDNGIKD